MDLEFEYTFQDYLEANRIHARRRRFYDMIPKRAFPSAEEMESFRRLVASKVPPRRWSLLPWR